MNSKTLLIEILFRMTPLISKQLRGALRDTLDDWEASGKSTNGPYDDILVLLLRGILSIE